MIAEYNIKPIASFICSNYEKYAVCDRKFNLEETSAPDFFSSFITEKDEKRLSAIEKNTDFSFNFSGVFYIVSVLPHYKTKKLIDGYILTAQTLNQEVILPFMSDNKGIFHQSLLRTQSSVNDILGINSKLRELSRKIGSDEMSLTLAESNSKLMNTLIDTVNMFSMLNGTTVQEDFEISDLFSAVKHEFIKKVGTVGRDVDVTLTPEYAFIRVIPEQFVSAIANSFYYLVKNSPKKQNISAEIVADDDNCIFRLSAKRSSAAEDLSTNTTLPQLLEKAISTDCNGSTTIEVKKSRNIITITLPRIYRPRKDSVESPIYEKITESDSIVNLLADAILSFEK